MLTLAELHEKLGELLETLAPDTPVILSSDSEGNSHAPLRDVEECRYLPDTAWSGEVYPAALEGEEETGEAGEPAVCLLPSD